MGRIHNCFLWFLQVSEFTNSTSDSTTLQWSDITSLSTTLTIRLCQWKTDPFRKGLTLNISATNASTCPVKALLWYRDMIPQSERNGSLFSAGRFFSVVANTCNEYSPLLTTANWSQFTVIFQSQFPHWSGYNLSCSRFSTLADWGIGLLEH